MQLTSDLTISNASQLNIEKIKMNSQDIFTRAANKSSYPEFYCFDDSENVTSSQDLNLKNLKKCSTCCTNKTHKFLVLDLPEKHLTLGHVITVLPNVLNKTKPTFSFECKNSDSDNTVVKFDGKLLGILHQGFSPT